MSKCIILSRVSTITQNIDEQENNLFKFAIQDGYKKSNIISISDKESAIKLDEQERNGLNQLKEYIINETIECVYVWELSRIARSPKVLYSIRDFLVEHKVQLKVFDPSLTLLNSDFTINENSSLIFGLYASMAEAEMRQKKVRFQRGKLRNSKIGKYNGGPIKYGYYVNNEGYLTIDEKKSEIIKLVFDLYITGTSETQVYREMRERGYDLTFNVIDGILHSNCYTGIEIKNGIEKKYPPIIDKLTFEKARETAIKNTTNSVKAKSIYFCRGLIKCEKCGHTIIAVRANLTYRCLDFAINNKRHENGDYCKDSSININIMDSIAWDFAKKTEILKLLKGQNDDIKEYENRIQINKQKIEATAVRINKLQEKKERNNDLFIDGNINKNKYNSNIKVINEDISLINSEVEKWNAEIKEFEKQIEVFKDSKQKELLKEFIEQNRANLESIDNQQIMYDIIHRNIKKITVTTEERYKTKIISIYDNNIINLPHLPKEVFRINIRTKVLERKTININKEGYYWQKLEYQFLNRFPYTK